MNPPNHIVRYSLRYRWETGSRRFARTPLACPLVDRPERKVDLHMTHLTPEQFLLLHPHCIPLRKEGQRFSKPHLAPCGLPPSLFITPAAEQSTGVSVA